VLKPDTYIVGATPGQGNYYTTLSGMQRTGLDVVSYYEGVQVAPNLTNPTYDVVRDGLNIYRVKESTPAAFGRALANTQYGEGGLPQLFISDYSNLQLVKFVPFINKIPGVKP
jgi:filamentous hemagglutinin